MYHAILVPIAPGLLPESDRAFELARNLLHPGGKITVLTVITPNPPHVAQQLPADTQTQDQQALAAALDAHFQGQRDIETRAEMGSPAQTILTAAAAGDHDCIIIAPNTSRLSAIALGSTAGKIVRDAQCGVHILR